jgi:hypothetical protein
MRSTIRLIILTGILLVVSSPALLGTARKNPGHPVALQAYNYPYASASFDKLIADSYAWGNVEKPQTFYRWLDTQYRQAQAAVNPAHYKSIRQLLAADRKTLLQTKDPAKKAKAEEQMAAQLHRLVKVLIPRFSLDRGFEFRNVVRYGERQCLLQSALIAGMLQTVGIRAGVVMVYTNEKGEQSNNGHAVTLVKLANGKDLLVDASEARPFALHKGLFVKRADYLFVQPVYAQKDPAIAEYIAAGNHAVLSDAKISALDYGFVSSQFYYYRGERAVAGTALEKRAGKDLLKSQQALQESVRLCPRNPLAVYMLGRAYLVEHRNTLAAATLARAHALYARFGWIPDGVKEYIAKANTFDKTRIRS